ncbi:MAG: phosphatidylinositol-3-phosphatase [Acidobacteriaceae bacterium]|nr:phosphatidylinositol-3-phosphatase [Acidobacteriaceae bacterium]
MYHCSLAALTNQEAYLPMKRSISPHIVRACAAALIAFLSFSWAHAQSNGPIVFLIVLENHNWTGTGGISGSYEAPYINKTLVPMAAVANNYFNPYGNHPSVPNYLWMEAGQNFGIYADGSPSQYHLSTHAHLSELLHNAGIPWRAYEESISGRVCPLTAEGSIDSSGSNLYVPRHLPQIYFSDMTSGRNPYSSYCIAHVRPLAELASNLKYNRIGRYNFITPNMCHDGHDRCGGNTIAHIDSWLKGFMPLLFNSTQYKEGRVTIFIATDEAANGDGPIMFMALGHGVKHGYKNEIRYTHSSLLRTLEEIFKVSPLLGHAAYARDLRDLFSTFP